MKSPHRSPRILTFLFSCACAAAFAGPVASDTPDMRRSHAPEISYHGAGFDVGFFGGGVLAPDLFGEAIVPPAWENGRALHLIHGDLELSTPLQSICLEPQFLLGPGASVKEPHEGEFRADAGLEAGFSNHFDHDILGDGSLGHDFTVVRFGLKLRL